MGFYLSPFFHILKSLHFNASESSTAALFVNSRGFVQQMTNHPFTEVLVLYGHLFLCLATPTDVFEAFDS
jgi:hypothetical protein